MVAVLGGFVAQEVLKVRLLEVCVQRQTIGVQWKIPPVEAVLVL
jgi:hypothetical protein